MEEEYKRKGPKEWLVRGYSTERWGQKPSLKEKQEQTEAGLFYSWRETVWAKLYNMGRWGFSNIIIQKRGPQQQQAADWEAGQIL